MERFSKDELFLIAINLDIKSLLNFCQTSKYINNKVCNNNNFWVNKLKKDFDFDFFVEHEISFPKSGSLREKYINTVPAKKEYLKYSKLVEGNTINDVLLNGIMKKDLNLIKIALYRGVSYQTDFLSDMIEMENCNKILNISMNYWMNNREITIKIIYDMLPIINNADRKDKTKIGIILFDIILPRAVKFLKKHKNFWLNSLIKFNEFVDAFPEFQEFYFRRLQLYKELAEISSSV